MFSKSIIRFLEQDSDIVAERIADNARDHSDLADALFNYMKHGKEVAAEQGKLAAELCACPDSCLRQHASDLIREFAALRVLCAPLKSIAEEVAAEVEKRMEKEQQEIEAEQMEELSGHALGAFRSHQSIFSGRAAI